jgi:hypothetical protein
MATIAVPATITATGASDAGFILCLLFNLSSVPLFRNKNAARSGGA